MYKVIENYNKKPQDILIQDPDIIFDAENHKYFDKKRNKYVARSISDVVRKTKFVNDNMLKAAERGTVIHEAAQIWCETKDVNLALAKAGKYKNWVEHLINYEMFNTWNPIANELRMIDRKRDIAGTCDVILENKNGKLVLADFKTMTKYEKKNHKCQIGGYLSLLQINYPTITIDRCRVIYITPEGIRTDDYMPMECIEDYEAVRSIYFDLQVPF